jgi:EmrB/QacA subfamily drug resistance transporter
VAGSETGRPLAGERHSAGGGLQALYPRAVGFHITEGNRRWWVVVAMTVAMLPLSIDTFGFVVALPTIGSEFSAGTAELAWILNVAILMFGSCTMAAGRLGDIIGRRRMVIWGMAVMVASSIGCAVAPSVGVLIVCRGIEGVSMAMLYGSSFPIVADAFPAEQRPTGIAYWAAGYLSGNVIGAPLAGWLTESVSWRALFWINLPLMATALAMTLLAVRESRDPTASRHIDWFGVGVPILGLLALLYGLQQANDVGWGSPRIELAFLIAAVLLGAFFFVEPRLKEPLIDFGLFRRRGYGAACAVAFLCNVGLAAQLFFTPLFLQGALDVSALAAGVVLMAASIPRCVVSLAAGRLIALTGTRSLMAIGMVAVSLNFVVYAVMGTGGNLAWILPALLIGGIGTGLAFNASNIGAIQASEPERAGMASGVVSELRLLGNVFGVALPLALFDALTTSKLNSLTSGHGTSVASTHQSEIKALLSGSVSAQQNLDSLPSGAAHAVESAVREVFAAGMRGAMALVALATLMAVPIVLRGGRRHAVAADDVPSARPAVLADDHQ